MTSIELAPLLQRIKELGGPLSERHLYEKSWLIAGTLIDNAERRGWEWRIEKNSCLFLARDKAIAHRYKYLAGFHCGPNALKNILSAYIQVSEAEARSGDHAPTLDG